MNSRKDRQRDAITKSAFTGKVVIYCEDGAVWHAVKRLDYSWVDAVGDSPGEAYERMVLAVRAEDTRRYTDRQKIDRIRRNSKIRAVCFWSFVGVVAVALGIVGVMP